MTIVGTISKEQRPNGQGSYYQLANDIGEWAISMTESVKPADDAKVLEPLIGKKVEADGILQRNTEMFRAFTVKAV